MNLAKCGVWSTVSLSPMKPGLQFFTQGSGQFAEASCCRAFAACLEGWFVAQAALARELLSGRGNESH